MSSSLKVSLGYINSDSKTAPNLTTVSLDSILENLVSTLVKITRENSEHTLSLVYQTSLELFCEIKFYVKSIKELTCLFIHNSLPGNFSGVYGGREGRRMPEQVRFVWKICATGAKRWLRGLRASPSSRRMCLEVLSTSGKQCQVRRDWVILAYGQLEKIQWKPGA